MYPPSARLGYVLFPLRLRDGTAVRRCSVRRCSVRGAGVAIVIVRAPMLAHGLECTAGILGDLLWCAMTVAWI